MLPGLAMLGCAGLIAVAGLARADDSEKEALYSRYHQAIEAAKLCRDMSFDQPAHDRMAGVIAERVKHDIGAKRLPLLTAAQRDVQAIVDKQGCGDSRIAELLTLFDAELAPALQ
jgi:hypothetical protein